MSSSQNKKEGFGVFLGIPREFGLVEDKSPREPRQGQDLSLAGVGGGRMTLQSHCTCRGWFYDELMLIF